MPSRPDGVPRNGGGSSDVIRTVDDWEHDAGGRQATPAQVAVAVALLVVLGVVVALAGRSRPDIDELEVGSEEGFEIERDLPTPPEQVEAAPEVQPPEREAVGEWSELPDAPLDRRSDALAVWTGHEIVVWGGLEGERQADGAAFDPARDRWREIPPAPFAAGAGTSAVWTGREMIAVDTDSGGAAGYDPEGDVWRELPEPPVTLAGATSAVWNGHEVLVVGRQPTSADGAEDAEDADAEDAEDAGAENARYRGVVIAYDPTRDSWRELPPSPIDEHGLLPSAVALGDRLAVLGATDDADGHPHLAIAVYDPADDDWSDPDLSPFSTTTDTWLLGMSSDDERVGIAGSLLRGSSWRFQAARWLPGEGWRRLPNPTPDGHADPFVALAPAGMLVWSGTLQEEGWVVTSDGWQPLPESLIPSRNGAAVTWTGQELFVWGGRQGPRAHDDGMRWRARDRTLEYCCSP